MRDAAARRSRDVHSQVCRRVFAKVDLSRCPEREKVGELKPKWPCKQLWTNRGRLGSLVINEKKKRPTMRRGKKKWAKMVAFELLLQPQENAQ